MSLYASNTVLKVTADALPTGMNAPTYLTSDVNPTNIKISWLALTDSTTNGGDLPNFYEVEWLDSGGNNYDTNVNT